MTLQPGATFLHIKGDLAALGRPQGIGWDNNRNKPSPKTKELQPIGVSSELLQGYWGNGA